MSSSFSLNVRYHNKIRKFQWRQKFLPNEFQSLLANVFSIKISNQLIGLMDNEGILHDFSGRNISRDQNLVYDLIVHEKSDNSFLFNRINKLDISIGFIENFTEFEEHFLNGDESQLTLIFFFEDLNSAYNELSNLSNFIQKNTTNIEFFYHISDSGDQENNSKNRKKERKKVEKSFYGLKKPFFSVFSGNEKKLDMTLSISGKDFNDILKKLQFERESDISSQIHEINDEEESQNEYEIDKNEENEISAYEIPSGSRVDIEDYEPKLIEEKNNISEFKLINVIAKLEIENKISEDESLIIKKEILENNNEVKKAINGFINNYFNDFVLIEKLKIYIKEKQKFNIQEEIIKFAKKYYKKEDIEIINKLIREKNNLLFTSFSIFMRDNDEEEFKDTIGRFLNKNQFIIHEEKPILYEKTNSYKENIVPTISSHNNNLKQFSLKDFIKENSDKFSNEDIGIVNNLVKTNDKEFLQILNQCNSIPNQNMILKLIKSITETKFLQFLMNNFESNEIKYIEKFKKSKTNQLYLIFEDFKTNSDLEKLKLNIEKVCIEQGIREKPKQRKSLITMNKPEEIKNNESLPPKENKIISRQITKNEVEIEKPVTKINNIEQKDSSKNIKDQNTLKMILKRGSLILEKESPSKEFHKNEIEELVNKFYEEEFTNQFQKEFEEVLEKSNFLDQKSKYKLQDQFNNNDFGLLAIISKYSRLKNISKIKDDLIKNLKKQNESYELSSSPLTKAKIKKLNSLKYILNELLLKNLISEKQMRTYSYLYLAEDVSIISIYELYLITENELDFLENLNILYKYVSSKSQNVENDINNFDEKTETLYVILYSFKKHLTLNERITIENLIKSGDEYLLNETKVPNFDKEEFIKNLKKYADKKTEEIFKIETIIEKNIDKKSIPKDQIIPENRKNLVYSMKDEGLLNQIQNFELLFKIIDEDHEKIKTIFELYESKKDQLKFLKDLTREYSNLYEGDYYKYLILKYKNERDWDGIKVDKILKAIDSKDKILMGAYEVFLLYIDKNAEDELMDTSNRYLKIK